ncbi:MAG: phenylalanine--tRNA ligase subunit beta [Eggerthellaceae bacterium]|nr:phenylalanine--tRNA ligase subunit beta [Eggerthellaceae bacterium]
MKVSLKWLSEYVEVPADLKAFCDRLDLTGTGVEGVERTGDMYDHVVTGQILEKQAHPDSDHMWVTKVDVGAANVDKDGNPEPLQIVCGAQNFNQGDHVVVATIGAVLPGDFKIKKSKLRGVVSCGMNCSARELGIGSDHDGIMILPEDAPIGMPLADYLKLSDTVLDLEITPNRPDCLSMVGMAREVGAMYAVDAKNPLDEMEAALAEGADLPSIEQLATVTVEDTDRCPRYTARVIKNVKVGPSPDWLAERVTAAGARSINNVVDVTNYILFLFGQPLHAFDYDKLVDETGKANVVVRAAKEGEKLLTLDGEERELTTDMTVIATPEKAVGLAGVMGGLDTEVTEETTTILLEAATFEPGRTSRTSRNLGLISESSMRYERRVDDVEIDRMSAAAAQLLAEVSGGTVVPGLIDVYNTKTEPEVLEFRIPRFQGMMGEAIPRDFIVDILQRLGCTVSEKDEQTLTVIPPTFRPDLEREIDLYEEVLRLYGMDRIPSTLPGGPGRVGIKTEAQRTMDKINNTLRACGLNETMTYSFADPHELEQLRMPTEGMGIPVELLNPLNAEQSVMRQSIIPGLMRSVAYNQSRGVHNIQLYETGVVFFGAEGRKSPKERNRLAVVMAGAMSDPSWNQASVAFDFFDGKGVIESLMRELAIAKPRFKALGAEEAPHLQPGRAAQVLDGGTVLGWIGEIHPLACDAYDVQAPVVAFELDLDALIKCARPARDYVDVPVFPAVTMDVAFVVDESVTHEQLSRCISSAGGKLLDKAQLFDVYRDEERLGAGKKSMAYALEYRAADRTLTTEEVDKQHARLIKKVCGATGAEVRG